MRFAKPGYALAGMRRQRQTGSDYRLPLQRLFARDRTAPAALQVNGPVRTVPRNNEDLRRLQISRQGALHTPAVGLERRTRFESRNRKTVGRVHSAWRHEVFVSLRGDRLRRKGKSVMRFLLVCNICKRAKPKQHWVATPPCFTPKPDVEIVKTACPKCCAKAIRLASEDVFGRLNYLQQSSAFAHFMGALISAGLVHNRRRVAPVG
jgi:hypothetical protein